MRRVTSIGGIFFQARDPVALRAWYKRHLGIDVQGGDCGPGTWGVGIDGTIVGQDRKKGEPLVSQRLTFFVGGWPASCYSVVMAR